MCTKISLWNVTNPFFLSETFVSQVSDNVIFLEFLRISHAPTRERHSRKKRERGCGGSMWKGANNGTHDLRCVSREHTDFKCFSPILLPPPPSAVVMAISYENTFRREDSAACGHECSPAVACCYGYMEYHRCSRSAPSRINSSKIDRYGGRTNGRIRKNSLDERALIILFSFNCLLGNILRKIIKTDLFLTN